MDILLMFILACYGLSVSLSIGKIFQPLRDWVSKKTQWGYKLIKCPMCTSFWIGIVITLILKNWPDQMYIPTIMPIYNGLIATAGSFLLHALAWRLALKDPDF